jgi:hypothetical protein
MASTIHGGVNTSPWSATRFFDFIRFTLGCLIAHLCRSKVGWKYSPSKYKIHKPTFLYPQLDSEFWHNSPESALTNMCSLTSKDGSQLLTRSRILNGAIS